MSNVIDRLEGAIREHIHDELPDDPTGELHSLSLGDLLVAYGTHKARLVPAQPRRVHRSREITASSKATEHEAEIDAIVRKIEAGEDLTPHLTRSIDKALSVDRMLAHQGVHHLHLSSALESDGRFVKRTGDLLFVAFRPDNAYLIGVYGHRTDWALKDIVERVARNWPEIGVVHELRSAVGFTQDYSDEERLALQSADISASGLVVDGKAYITLGGTLGGNSMSASMESMGVTWKLREWREDLDRRLPEVEDAVDAFAGHEVRGDWKAIVIAGLAGLVRGDVFFPVVQLPG